MKYINLINELTDKDKATITAYLETYGCDKNYLLPLDAWLQNWSHANQKLYKLLGNSFIKEFSFEYEKENNQLRNEITTLLYERNNFRVNYNTFINELRDNCEKYEINSDQIYALNKFINHYVLLDNKIDTSIKYKKPGAKKILQIQRGAKPFRALNQVISYFKDDYEWDMDAFEDLRKKHAIIFSEKTVKGSVCVSIHPMDFLTMSDNDSNWTSCMSWAHDGCYHIGTVEMMNSNNVVCCYLKNNEPYVFNQDTIDPETGEILGVWNNKRWRQLVYVTKDIIMSGKPYPYVTLDLTKKILDVVKDLAKENLKWTYQFGPERYKDMTHIDSLYKMDNQRAWIRTKSFKKHNIIWDTRGMYNDMLNDPNTNYMCYRNKVDHTKIINVSGKATCLCCSRDVLTYDDYTDEYNDRYSDTGHVICDNCIDTHFRCSYCDEIDTNHPLIRSRTNGTICKNCFETKVRRCPCCGEIFYVEGNRIQDVVSNPYLYKAVVTNPTEYRKLNQSIKDGDFHICIPCHGYTEEDIDKMLKDFQSERKYPYFEIGYCCSNCQDKVRNEIIKDSSTFKFMRKSFWSNTLNEYYLASPEKINKYLYFNLKKVSLKEFDNETMVG